MAAAGEEWRTDAATYIHRGFAPTELVWGVKSDGFVGLAQTHFREQSTIERWLFDDRGSKMIGAEFLAIANSAIQGYVLPAGMVPDTARLLVVNIAATGNNIEGVPPTRPIIAIDKLRQLIVQTFGISYQRFGVPFVKVFIQMFEDLSKNLAAVGAQVNFHDVVKTVSRFDNLRARQPGSIALKPGIDAEFMTPLGDFPMPLPMLRYLDELKGLAFANESATLGMSTFGSYAMAEVADNKFLRSAPFYGAPIVRGYNQLMRLHVMWNYPRAAELEIFPHYKLRFAGALDSSKWIADVVTLWQAEPWTMPEDVRRMAAANLGLPRETFDDGPVRALGAIQDAAGELGVEDGAIAGAGADLAATALNGAQVSSMVEVLSQVAAGVLAPQSAIRILMRAFQMSRADAAAMVNPASVVTAPTGEEE
jgi:hypothetical protein